MPYGQPWWRLEIPLGSVWWSSCGVAYTVCIGQLYCCTLFRCEDDKWAAERFEIEPTALVSERSHLRSDFLQWLQRGQSSLSLRLELTVTITTITKICLALPVALNKLKKLSPNYNRRIATYERKLGTLKTRDWKSRDWKTRDQVTGVENAGLENAGPTNSDKVWKA